MKEVLDWANDTTPVSKRFDDIYFAKESGLEESLYAFVDQSKMDRLAEENDFLHFGELGFGTGLNFCLSAQRFLELKNKKARRLYYSSIEAFPLKAEQIRECLSCWPELKPIMAELLRVYEKFPPGAYRFELFEGRVILDLYFCDVIEALQKFTHSVDVWYLDGFSPKKNPEMWSDQCFDWICAHSKAGTKICTYASTAFVRKKLESLGFSVEKFPGFGKRRESMFADVPGQSSPNRSRSDNRRIIGAGIAGMSLAQRFARKGVHCEIVDRHAQAGQEASGNVRAIVKPSLESQFNRRTQFSISAFAFARQIYKQYHWEETGCVDIAHKDKAKRVLAVQKYLTSFDESFSSFLSAEETNERLSIAVNESSYFLNLVGLLNPHNFFQSVLEEFSSRVQFKQREMSPEEFAQGDFICIAGAAKNLPVTEAFPIRLKRGQVVELDHAPSRPQHIMNYGGYLLSFEGRCLLGSTYDRDSTEPIVKPEDNQKMLDQLTDCLQEPKAWEKTEFSNARAGVRASLRDALPVVGMKNGYGCNFAYGSRGFTYGPWCAEYLSCLSMEEPVPPDPGFARLISPNRAI